MARSMEQGTGVNEGSLISAGTVIKGEITTPNDIRIDGAFEGKIKSQGRVTVGEKAVIDGDIICRDVEFWGRINGSFYVRDTLSLKEGCVVNGDLHVRRLAVELGAHFDGRCAMLADGEFEKVAGDVSGQAPEAE